MSCVARTACARHATALPHAVRLPHTNYLPGFLRVLFQMRHACQLVNRAYSLEIKLLSFCLRMATVNFSET